MSDNAEKPNDDTISTLIDQLKDTSVLANKASTPAEQFELSKEDLENFVINNAGKLIKESLDTIEQYKEYVTAAPNADDISAYADLIKATSTAVESLNKILVQDKRSATSEKVKLLDLQGKQQLQDHEEANYLLRGTRQELLEEILKKADAIDVSPAKIVPTLSSSSTDA